MKIETGKLYSSYINLLSIVKKYEENVNNIQLCYNDISNYWKDGNTDVFFDKINLNKKNTQNILLDLNDLIDIYKAMYNKYNEIGNKIAFSMENETIVYNKIDRCINILEKLKYKYLNLLNLDEFNKVSYDINDNIILLDTIKTKLLNLKDIIKNMSQKLKSIEKEINTKISKIKINYIKEDLMDDIRQ